MTGTRQWLVLCVVLMGTFMAVLDVAIVNVAIPSIHNDLHASFGEVEFIVSAYTITYACLLVTGGRLGDNYGRRLLFILGLLLFAVASAGCGLAPTTNALIVARAIQGVGGAMMYPQVLAIIQITFTGTERAKALGVFGSVIGIAAIAGQLIGGSILALDIWGLEWRPIFLVNVPIALATIVAAILILPKDTDNKPVGLDWGGVALMTPAMLLLVVPLLEGHEEGWPLWLVACFIASFPMFALFIWYERRVARKGGRPLVRLELFANKSFSVGTMIAGLFMGSYAGYLIILAIYLQIGLGFSPLRSGLTYTPSAIGFFITSLIAPRLVPLLGRYVLSIGYVLAGAGLLATATAAFAAGTHLHGFELVPSLFVIGIGMGLGMSPLVGTVIAGLPPSEAGSGAGIVTTTLQVGSTLGIALISLLFFTLLGDGKPGVDYSDAFAMALPVCAALLFFAAYLVRRLPRMPFEASNALIERLPGWSAGFAYSMFLMTGGRLGDSLIQDVASRVAERRLRLAREAPQAPGDFLAYQFHNAGEDIGWLRYLMREALVYGDRPVPLEAGRQPAIDAQIDEVRHRQATGLLDPALDPAQLRLMDFALVNYPRLLPQITRMTTGLSPEDPRFTAGWESLLRTVGKSFEGDAGRKNDGG